MSTSWAHPDRIHPPSAGHGLGAVSITLLVISTLMVIIRLYTRIFIIKVVKWDDYLIVPAWMFATVSSICAVLVIRYGYGNHIWDLNFDNWARMCLTSWLLYLSFTISIALIKLSFLNVYLRFAIPGLPFQRTIYLTMGVVMLWGVTFTLLLIFQCYPTHRYWTNGPLNYAHCISPRIVPILNYVHGALNSATDLVIFVMPIRLIWTLQIPKLQKCGLIALLGAGGCCAVVGITRLAYVIKTREKGADATFEAYWLVLCTILELHVGIICACIPAVKPLFTKAQATVSNTIHDISGSRIKSASQNSVIPRMSGATETSQDVEHLGVNRSRWVPLSEIELNGLQCQPGGLCENKRNDRARFADD